MAVILKERYGWGLACAELIHLALQEFLLGLKLVLAAQCYLQPLYCLLQHLPLAQKQHPFPGVGVLFLTLELTLQLTDRLLLAQHLFGGHSQFICHRGQRVLHALQGQLIQLQLSRLQLFTLFKK